MKNLSRCIKLVFQISFVCISCQGQTATTGDSRSKDLVEDKTVSGFLGAWDGTITYDGQNGNTTNRLVVEIIPVKDREVRVEIEEIGWAYPPMSGPGVITPNAISWVELNSKDGWALYRRFMGGLSATNDQITGKCFWSTVEESASFVLKRTDVEAVRAFRIANQKAIERLRVAAQNV